MLEELNYYFDSSERFYGKGRVILEYKENYDNVKAEVASFEQRGDGIVGDTGASCNPINTSVNYPFEMYQVPK